MHSSPSFNGPPPAPPPPFPSSFSFFLLFMFSCFAVSAWVSTVGGVTCLNACTRGVTIFDQRRWQSASCLAKHIFLRSLRVQHVLTFSEPNLWKMFESLLARLAPVFGVWGIHFRKNLPKTNRKSKKKRLRTAKHVLAYCYHLKNSLNVIWFLWLTS